LNKSVRGVSFFVLAAGVVTLLLPFSAHAQRTDDNATAESDDAFGRSVGDERIGIYNSDDVRGFSPIDAGNVRLEGLYLDRQTDPTLRLIEGSAIRVGVAAQSYPFPSPTGIVDYDIRRVADRRVISPVVNYGPFGSLGVEVDAKLPLVRDRFGVAAGAGFYRDHFEWGGGNRANSLAIIPRWRPTEDIEILPFYSRVKFDEEEPQPLLFTADGKPPPQIRREHYFGQRWAQVEGKTSTYGMLGNAEFGAWTARFGLFESVFAPDADFAELFTDIDANGMAHETVIAFPESRFGSRSGEFRLARDFEDRDRRHTLLLMAKGRLQKRRYGGEQEIDAGFMPLGEGRAMARPEFAFTEQSSDEVEQGTGGVAYELRWKDVGEMSVGVQKTFYSKSVETPAGELPKSRAEPTLISATGTVYVTERLAVYGSYTEGLEESPVAPNNALNRNEAAPALQTEQYDAGVRLGITSDLKLIAGVFNIEKPYFDVDPGRVFKSLGTVEHRGVELSLAGSPLKNLTVVAGTRYLDAEVSGPIVSAGIIGAEPVGIAKMYSIASFDYTLAGTGASVDAVIESITKTMANTANTVEVGGRSVVHLGGRYRFKLFTKPATLRVQMHNVFDRYGWIVVSGGAYVYNGPRRLTVYLATDL
jgi:iron complex outermembrane recepter protein